jgi:hypothetical protein
MINLYSFLIAKKIAENKGVDSKRASRLALIPAAAGVSMPAGVALVSSTARSEVSEKKASDLEKRARTGEEMAHSVSAIAFEAGKADAAKAALEAKGYTVKILTDETTELADLAKVINRVDKVSLVGKEFRMIVTAP